MTVTANEPCSVALVKIQPAVGCDTGLVRSAPGPDNNFLTKGVGPMGRWADKRPCTVEANAGPTDVANSLQERGSISDTIRDRHRFDRWFFTPIEQTLLLSFLVAEILFAGFLLAITGQSVM